MRGFLSIAEPADAAAVAALQTAVAEDLTRQFGIGHWSSIITEKSVRAGMRRAAVFILREDDRIVVTLTLASRKPWAIDRHDFTPVARLLYLVAMAVDPAQQGTGIGRACAAETFEIGREWPADAVCLDAYDTPAGA